MTQELVKHEPSVPSLGVQEEPGLHGEFDQGDIALPICAITQPTSAEERGEAGLFWFNDGRSVAEMDTVVLDILSTRTLWAPRGKGNIDGILCRSNNRREGNMRYPTVVLGKERAKALGIADDSQPAIMVCAECPHYNDDQFASSDYLCKKGFTLLMVDRDTETPFLFFVKGAAMRVVIRSVVSPTVMRVKRNQPAAPWTTPYHWSTLKTENAKGKFWVPQITPLPPLSDEDAAYYAEMSVSMAGRAAEQLDEEDLGVTDASAEQPELV